MQVFEYNDFYQNAAKVFDVALTQEVIVKNTNGYNYKILPIKTDNSVERSPFDDIPGVKVNISTQEIVELLRESRAGI
ncbi:MAG: hypothetical protein LBH43_21680 [Treponema sp.]|jgi:hypothetical protein|nr:hypothetical protein [Treponema sp.]